MKKSIVFNGQFKLETGGHFAPKLVVNLDWKVVINLTGFSRKPYTDILCIFYGRGHTQNTWRDIYLKLTLANKEGWDFVNKPELLLQMKPSIWATFYAMTTGLYTGVKLSTYFNETINKSVAARKIINGTDNAFLISGYYDKFLKSINENK